MRFPTAAALLCTTTAAALVATGGVAAAADGNTKTTVYTVANPGACAGVVNVGLGHYPGQATLFINGMLYGFAPCSVELTFAFTRRGDNATASYTRTLNGPGPVGTSKDVVGPGTGVWDVTVTSNGASFGAQDMTIDIQPYQG